MSHFLSQIFLALALLLTWGLFNDQFLQKLVFEKSLESQSEARHIILGDSHGRCIWFEQGVNLSSDGAPILIQYLQLLQALPLMGEVKDVWVSVGPQNFSSLPIDRLTNNYENFLGGTARQLAAVTSGLHEEIPFTPEMTRKRLIHEFVPPATPEFTTERYPGTRNDLSDKLTIARLTRHRVMPSDWFVQHELTTEVFQKLAAMDDVVIHLVGTPIHSSYLRQTGKEGWTKYKDFLSGLDALPNVVYHSFEETDLPDAFFQDADHLNAEGSVWLSDTLAKLLPAIER